MANCFKCKGKIGFFNTTIECENCAKCIGCCKCVSEDSYHNSNAYCSPCKKESIEEDEVEEYDDTTYVAHIKCENCSNISSYGIKKGFTIKEYLINKVCNNCGCVLEKK